MHAIAEFGVQWTLQSLVVTVLALVLVRVVRKKGAAMQNVVLRLAIVALWVCPIATMGVSRLHLGGVPITLPAPAPPAVSETREAEVFATPITNVSVTTPRIEIDPVSDDIASSHALRFDVRSALYALVASAWLLGIAYSLGMLAHSYIALRRVRKRGEPVSNEIDAMLASLARSMKTRTPRIATHESVTSPCVTGITRPIILLPKSLASGDPAFLRSILIHELAHVARRDCAWNLLAYLTASALWFQPLVWLVRKRLDETSDLIADDYVLHHNHERADYARRLVTLAESFAQPRRESLASAGIAPLKSELGKRIARILDASRQIRLRASRRSVALIALLTLATTFAAGIIGAAALKGRAIDPIVGTVYSTDGKPIPNAEVELMLNEYDYDHPREPIRQTITKTTCSADGAFTLDGLRITKSIQAYLLIAKAPAYAYAYLHFEREKDDPQRFYSNFYESPSKTADFVLRPSRDLRGVVVGRDKKPIKGALLRCSDVFQIVATDDKGEFVIKDVPDNPQGSPDIYVSHSDYVPQTVRPMASDQDLKIKMDSGCLIEGRATDVETGRGVSGVWIISKQRGEFGNEATTDEEGKYRLRLTPGQINVIASRAPSKDPLANNYIVVKIPPVTFVAQGDTKSGVDFVVTKGHIVRGRVIDGGTQKPVPDVRVSIEEAEGTEPRHLYWKLRIGTTDTEGKFAIAAIAAGKYSVLGRTSDESMKIRPLVLEVKNGEEVAPLELIADRNAQSASKYLPPGMVVGKVLLPDGKPAPMASIEAQGNTPNESELVMGHCRPDGSFSLDIASYELSGPGVFRAQNMNQTFGGVMEVQDVASPSQPLIIKLKEGAALA